VGLAVDNEVDVALAVQNDILGTMLGHQHEAQLLEQRFQRVGHGRCEFDELEALQSHGVVEEVLAFYDGSLRSGSVDALKVLLER
jgi:hypothetical protein